MASIKNLYYKKVAQDILDDKNNDYKWLNIKLKKYFRIDAIDKVNNYFVKPYDCRWWFGNTKNIRYNNICKKMPRGKRKEMQMLLEHILNLRLSHPLFIPPHPISGYKFEKDITKPGSYLLCYKGLVVNKIIEIHKQDKDEQENKCPICYEDINSEKNYIATLCGHKFCSICIFKNINLGKEQCPLCRTNITTDKNYSDLNYHRPETEFRRFEAPNAPRPPRWLYPRRPPPPPPEQPPHQITLTSPEHSSIVTLQPSINTTPTNPLFTENDISQIRNGYNEPILNALDEIRDLYSDVSNSDDELHNTSEFTGMLSNINDTITNSPVIFYNNNIDVTNDFFTTEITQALNTFVDQNTNTQHQISESNITHSTNDIISTNDEYYYFYNDLDDSQPTSSVIEPVYQYMRDISINNIDNSFNIYRLHNFI